MKTLKPELVLLRILLPVCLFATFVIRYNGFSFVYLLMFLICPYIKYKEFIEGKISTSIFLFVLIILSGTFSIGMGLMNVVMIFNPTLSTNCSNSLTSITYQIGITRLNGIVFYRVLRLVLPDHLIFVMTIFLFIYCRKPKIKCCQISAQNKQLKINVKLEDTTSTETPKSQCNPLSSNMASFLKLSENNLTKDNESEKNMKRRQSQPIYMATNYIQKTFGIDQLQKKSRRMEDLFFFFNVAMTGIAGISSPSVCHSLYLILFLGICTYWAYGNRVMKSNFIYLRIFLLSYLAVHICIVYIIQIEFSQIFIPNGHFLSRILGLYYIINTSCQNNGKFTFNQQRYGDYLSPILLIFVYYLYAVETGHLLEKFLKTPKQKSGPGEHFQNITDNNVKDGDDAEIELEMLPKTSTDQGYTGSQISTDSLEVNKENCETTAHARSLNQNYNKRPLLLDIIDTAIRNSFVFTFIAMMVWSATYKSWMSFVLLLLACYLWMTPNSRTACLYASPAIVFYATSLIIIQYIYGFNLPELPTNYVTASGSVIDFNEIGLQKLQNPFGRLAVMISFLVIFWLTLRLFMIDTILQIRKTKSKRMNNIDVNSLQNSKLSLENVGNVFYKKTMIFLVIFCEKYWILICCMTMLCFSVQRPVVLFKIIYMIMLLYFLLIFMFSFSFWRRQMKVFWWIVIIYSVIVLLFTYTFQFEPFPFIWQNKSGLSQETLLDIGLLRYETSTIFQGLFIPVLFLVILIVQLRYFHKPFLKLSSLDRFNYHSNNNDGEKKRDEGYFFTAQSSLANSEASEFFNDINMVLRLLIEKIITLLEISNRKVWQILECHFIKLVMFLMIYVCVNEINASNIVLILTVVVGFIFPNLHGAAVTISFLCCSLILLMKMIYQLKTFPSLNWITNCSTSINSQTNNKDIGKWIGLEKVEDFSSHIWKYICILIACSMWHVIEYHQKQLNKHMGIRNHPKGIIFPEITIHSQLNSIIDFLKSCINFSFYKMGLEFCFIVTIIVSCLRVDVYSLIYLILLIVFLSAKRQTCSKLWLPYLIFLGALLPIQYMICVGLPPGLCKEYYWNGINPTIQRWLYLPSYQNPPNAKKIMADFFQFVFVALQYHVFRMEDSTKFSSYNYGKNRAKNHISTKFSDKDFITTKDSCVDYLKHGLFSYWYWLSLAIVFLTGLFWITLFCLGYLIISFIYLWMDKNVFLRNRRQRILSWNIIIFYTFFVIFSKCTLQLIGCAFVKELINKGLCMLIPLFGIQCINPMSWDIVNVNTTQFGNYCLSVPNGLHWDVICFFFVIIQKKIFVFKMFNYVVLDINVQHIFASRGAYLINKKMMAVINEQKVREECELKKIQKKIENIMERQARHGKPELTEHYLVMRSGDFYLYDDDDEESDNKENNTNSNKYNAQISECSSEEIMSWKKETSFSTLEPILENKVLGNLTEHISQCLFNDEEKKIEQDTSSSEDDESYNLLEENKINPMQLISEAFGHGPTAAIRKYRRSISESRENLLSLLQSNSRFQSHRNSLAKSDERGILPNVTATIQRQSKAITEESINRLEEGDNKSIIEMDRHSLTLTESEIHSANSVVSDIQISNNQFSDSQTKNESNSESPESGWKKFKSSILVAYYFIQNTTDHLIKWFNNWTEEYRRIGRKLDYEKRLIKGLVVTKFEDKITEKLQEIKATVGNGSQCLTKSYDIDDIPKVSEFQGSTSRLFTLIMSIGNVATIHSEFVCYFLLIFNHVMSANLISLPYPLMTFLWAMLSVPRPSKKLWTFLITYIEIIIVIKYIFQFNFIKFNSSQTTNNRIDPLWIPLIIGIEKSKNYAILDLILLLFIFLHRGYLKRNGLWRDHAEFAQDLKILNKKEHKIKFSLDIQSVTSKKPSFNPIVKMRNFYSKMTNPKLNKKVDVYSYMFVCEFFALVIIILGYASFGPGTDAADNAIDFIKTNKIPVPFIVMIITQFIVILIDRALFLRKQVKGKFIFQIIHVLLIHLWLFFGLPYITKRKFNSHIAPPLLYMCKCIYFGLSAYQIKSGYPRRILGNFLRKNFNYINLILFKGYMIIPFLYELRNVMDWMWTDTSVALYHWMEVEDTFCKIFVLKCWRRAEVEYPTMRGTKRRLWVKYLVGGLLLTFFLTCFWGPLTLSSFIVTTFAKNHPIECSFSIDVGGYSSLFVFSSRENNLKSLDKTTFEKMKECYKHHSSSMDYLQSFEPDDVIEMSIDGESDDTWLITPPGFEKLLKKLESKNESLKINIQTICERGPTDSKSADKVVRYTYSRILTEKEKKQLSSSMKSFNTTSTVYLTFVFPRFLTAYKQKLLEAQSLHKSRNYTFLNLNLTMRHQKSIMWWEITENVYGETYCSNQKVKPESRSNITVYIFNERISDNFFGHIFSKYGIIGIYAAYFFVVHRILRTFYSNISYIIQFEELPDVDRILQLLNDIYLVRENKLYRLEEQLIAKLIFLYRSSETMIKWTTHKKSIIDKYSENQNPLNDQNDNPIDHKGK